MYTGPAEPSRLPEVRTHAPRDRYWLHLLLFVLTLLTTTAAGAAFSWSFQQNRPLTFEDLFPDVRNVSFLMGGLPYSLTLLAILFAHEMGHYIACRYYGVRASLPYFIGVPTLIGTLGAFIRIRSAIPSRKQLFDIGIAGPLAGYVFVLPALGIGLAYSKVIPGIAEQGDFVFGVPLILKLFAALIFPGVPPSDIYLHPVARAAWFGVFATALNLMPIGQLDGGHILYAMFGKLHRPLTILFSLALVPLGIFYSWTWLVWAALLLIFARRHPRIYDEAPLGPGRARLGLLSLVIFVISFSVVPIQI